MTVYQNQDGGEDVTRPIKERFRDIVEEWEDYWKDSIAFYDFLEDYVEINDDQRSYVIKKKKHRVGEE